MNIVDFSDSLTKLIAERNDLAERLARTEQMFKLAIIHADGKLDFQSLAEVNQPMLEDVDISFGNRISLARKSGLNYLKYEAFRDELLVPVDNRPGEPFFYIGK